MKKRILFVLLGLGVLTGMLITAPVQAEAPSAEICLGGAVAQPMCLKVEDLLRLEDATVRQAELTTDKKFHGTFVFKGVPLKTLLTLARIRKDKDAPFNKEVDLAVVVRSKSGKQVVLAWGEVFYRNPSHAILAYSATPVIPHHRPEAQPARTFSFPKLVMETDFFTDRMIEDVARIDVVDLKLKPAGQKGAKLFSPGITIVSEGKTLLSLESLAGYPRLEVLNKIVGDGMGYHGMPLYAGTPLVRLLEKTGASMNADTLIVVSAVDGYRCSFSYGELFLSEAGRRILMVDQADGKPLEKMGKFLLAPADDLAADRDVKAVSRIDIIPMNKNVKAVK